MRQLNLSHLGLSVQVNKEDVIYTLHNKYTGCEAVFLVLFIKEKCNVVELTLSKFAFKRFNYFNFRVSKGSTVLQSNVKTTKIELNGLQV